MLAQFDSVTTLKGDIMEVKFIDKTVFLKKDFEKIEKEIDNLVKTIPDTVEGIEYLHTQQKKLILRGGWSYDKFMAKYLYKYLKELSELV